MKGWRYQKIGSFSEIGRGSSPRPIIDQAYFVDGNIPWIKIADATASFKYIFKTKEHVNEYGASFSRKLPPGSLILAASGTLGFPIFLGVEGCIHDGWLYFKSIDTNVDRQYLYYCLITFINSFNSISYGAAIQNINTDILRNTEIPLPPPFIQRKIAAVLSAYDDLIENNNRRIALLEKMAEELYREWFVRLRFPGHEKAKFHKGIPDGWEIESLGNCIELAYGKALKEENRLPGDYPVYGSSGVIGYHNQFLAKGPGIIIGRKGNVGSVHWSNDNFFPIDTAYYVKTDLSLYYVFYLLHQMNFLNNDAAVPGLNRNQAYSNKFFLPYKELIEAFVNKIDLLFTYLSKINRMNAKLKHSRDRLLSRLMSGRLDVENLDIHFPKSMEESIA